MSRNILLGYSGSLVGVPPSPRRPPARPTEHAFRRGFALRRGLSFCSHAVAFFCTSAQKQSLETQNCTIMENTFCRDWKKSKAQNALLKIQINQRFVDKHDSPESFLVPFFVMVSCPCWHFTMILSLAENPVCSSHFPCKKICGGACL